MNTPRSATVRRTLRAALACTLISSALLATLAAPAFGGERERGIGAGPNLKPRWLGAVRSTAYDGVRDDLLTAGLGKTGLGGAAPAVTNPQDPAQLRRLAIWTNYRAVLDITPGGGYGTLYGPNVRADGTVTASEGLIAGTEHLAYADDGSGRENVTLMVQVPASFDPAHACILSGTSSGSRGVYGAIGTSGEWGLKHGCAVAYADKGSGNGVHDLTSDTVNRIDGTRASAAVAGRESNFTAALTPQALQQFNADFPNRVAVKHAHSQLNPEKDWGRDTLRSIEFAFYVLNEQYGSTLPRGLKQRTLTSRNTVVIAAGISNGGGAALAAAEQDRRGLIDGVAVSEPQVQTRRREPPAVQRGTAAPYTAGSRPLLDYFTYANLYQPCAALSARAANAALPFPAALVPLAQARCQSLADKGLLNGSTTAAQADDALDRLLAYGYEADTIDYQVSHWRFATPAIAMTYSNSYGRFSVADTLCGLSFAGTDATGAPAPLNPLALALVFATGNGVPPSSGINIVSNLSLGGPRLDTLAVSPSTGRADFNLDGALCQRALITGNDANALRTQVGIAQVQQRGELRGKPAIIVHGRSDTLVPVNFSSRAYYAANQDEDGEHSALRYVEVTHAQHFDSFLGLPGYANTLVPLHVYFNRALDAMYAHLTQGAPLPPSQVVRTTPRGGGFAPPAITAANVPPWQAAPPEADRIRFEDEVLFVPD